MKINYIKNKKSDASCCIINSSSRILIIGTSGSGKTSFAELICKKHNLHNIELDSLFWKANWIESGNEEFRNMIKDTIRQLERSATYQRAIRFGMIEVKEWDGLFYFEKFEPGKINVEKH